MHAQIRFVIITIDRYQSFFNSYNSKRNYIKIQEKIVESFNSAELFTSDIFLWDDKTLDRQVRLTNYTMCASNTVFSSIYIYSRPIPLHGHTHTCCDSGMITDDLSVTGCRYRGWIIVLIAKYEIIRERDRRPSIIGQRWPLVRRRSFIILAQPSPSSYSHRIADIPLFVYRT